MQSIIAFISDFGLEDTWVGVCHAVIHRACPQTRVVDLGHQIPPFDIRKGAATAVAGVHQLPDAIHLVVVDPGVGGGRSDLIIVTRAGTRLVGPDNGVLVPATLRCGGPELIVAIDSAKIDFGSPLPTFHARDVLAPAAAALACGVDPLSLGSAVDPGDLCPGPFGVAHVESGHLLVEVIEADRFGSIRLSVSEEELRAHGFWKDRIRLGFGHLVLEVPLASTFADVAEGEPVALIDSSGWLTLAVRLGSAAERYGLEPGVAARISCLS